MTPDAGLGPCGREGQSRPHLDLALGHLACGSELAAVTGKRGHFSRTGSRSSRTPAPATPALIRVRAGGGQVLLAACTKEFLYICRGIASHQQGIVPTEEMADCARSVNGCRTRSVSRIRSVSPCLASVGDSVGESCSWRPRSVKSSGSVSARPRCYGLLRFPNRESGSKHTLAKYIALHTDILLFILLHTLGTVHTITYCSYCRSYSVLS